MAGRIDTAPSYHVRAEHEGVLLPGRAEIEWAVALDNLSSLHMVVSAVSVVSPLALYQYGVMTVMLYYTTTSNWSKFNMVQQQLDAAGAVTVADSEGKAMNAGEVMEEMVAIFLILAVDYLSGLVALFALSAGNVLIKLGPTRTDRMSEQKSSVKLCSFLLSVTLTNVLVISYIRSHSQMLYFRS